MGPLTFHLGCACQFKGRVFAAFASSDINMALATNLLCRAQGHWPSEPPAPGGLAIAQQARAHVSFQDLVGRVPSKSKHCEHVRQLKLTDLGSKAATGPRVATCLADASKYLKSKQLSEAQKALLLRWKASQGTRKRPPECDMQSSARDKASRVPGLLSVRPEGVACDISRLFRLGSDLLQCPDTS